VPVKKAQSTAVGAAADAATTVASALDATTVGVAGEVTSVGAQVVQDAVGLVEGLVGGGKKP
jgi:hypothetical protein